MNLLEGSKMNEMSERKEVWQLTNIKNKQLAKSKNLRITSLSDRLTNTQNVLFSFALLNAKVDDNFAEAVFTIDDLKEFVSLIDYDTNRKTKILKDLKAVGESSILMIDEQMVLDPANGSAKGIMIFSSYSYTKGKYRFVFNSNKIEKDGIAPILGVLKSKEDNPLIYRLDMFASLNFAGQALYENILIANQQGFRRIELTNEDLCGVFGAVGKSLDRFDTIRRRHLEPAIESINDNTELSVLYEPIKKGRKIVGAMLLWSTDKSKPATDSQIAIATELLVELSDLGYNKNSTLLADLNKISKKTVGKAIKVIEKATKELRELRKNIAKTATEEVQAVQKTIENKREEETKRAEMIEAEKAAKRAEIPRFETIPPLDAEAIQKRNKLEKQLMSYFKRVSETNKMNILDLVCVYEDAEEMLQFARQIYKENNGQSMGYIIKILRNWQKNNVQNLTDAKQFQKTNFGTKDKSSNKKSEKKKGNDPSWSNPDYKNMTSEEKKAEMAVKKQEMLDRLDKSVKK